MMMMVVMTMVMTMVTMMISNQNDVNAAQMNPEFDILNDLGLQCKYIWPVRQNHY